MRQATVERNTKETQIRVVLNLDGSGQRHIATPLPFFNHMLDSLGRHSLVDLEIDARGDVEVDGHHTVEDVGICLGQAFREALGDKRGITRFGDAAIPMDEALARAAVDFGGRGCLVYLAESASGDVVLRASQIPHRAEIGHLRMKAGEGVAGWVAEHRAPVVLSHGAFEDSRFKRFPSLVEDTYDAMLSVPLVSGGEVIGVINVHHKAAHAHQPEEIAVVTFIGEQLGGAIAKARLLDGQIVGHHAQFLGQRRQAALAGAVRGDPGDRVAVRAGRRGAEEAGEGVFDRHRDDVPYLLPVNAEDL